MEVVCDGARRAGAHRRPPSAAGVVLRGVTQRTRSLRHLLLVVTFGSLAIGAVAAVVLARLMVLDADGARAAVGVLALTAVFATVLVLARVGAARSRRPAGSRRPCAASRPATARCAPGCSGPTSWATSGGRSTS